MHYLSTLRNLDKGGPLRPVHNPYGNANDPSVFLGNALWRRTLFVARLCLGKNIAVAIEHPQGSVAWKWPETLKLIADYSLLSVRWNHCAFAPDLEDVLPSPKPTMLLTSAAWLEPLGKRCDGLHVHGPVLRGRRAKAAAAYPLAFCQEVADACRSHFG